MASPSQSSAEKQLAELQLTFKNNIPAKLTKIDQLWDELCQSEAGKTPLLDMHLIAHSLAGTSGTFGAMPISIAARELEQKLKSLLNELEQTSSSSVLLTSEIQQQLKLLITQLKQTCENWQPSNIPYIKPAEVKVQRAGNLVYLVDDDELFSADLITKLEQFDFRVKSFVNATDFISACETEMPAAIIMDMVFSENEVAGADIISKLKCKLESCPPVIFISVRSDIEVRLAAARAGACRYFRKPFDIKKLNQTLDSLTARTITEPFRILIIDDDESLLQYYAMVLRDAGMEIKTLSDPLQALHVIEEYKPEIVVMDVYMPECSGLELAQVIRQDDSWAQIPIMFLSTESDLSRQLEALNLGGDDFLEKPVEAEHFVSVVSARAKRARWVSQLNHDLKDSIREGEYQHITMDQHDIVSHTDVAGRITSVNEKFCEISGYSRKELIGQNHRLLKSDYHPDSFYTGMWNTISQGKVWHGTICNKKKNGDEYWVESTIVPFLDDKGKPYKYVSARTDITALRASEERLERSQEFANIGTWDWNIRTGDLFWSDRIWPLFGYKKSETETTYDNFLLALHPADRKKVMDAVNDCVEHGTEYNIEHRVLWPDGSAHWVHESGDVMRSEKGEALHMLGVVQDIDARKRTELALVSSEQELRKAQTLARIGNWQADMITGELSWSDEIYRIFGFEPGSFASSVEAFHKMIHPDDVAKVHESEKRAEQTGLHDVVHRIVLPDGTVRHVHELAKAETDADGQLLRMSGTVQDITEREEAEVKLRETEERLIFAVEGAGDGVWEWDVRTNAFQHSRLAMEMLGYEENEFPYHLNTWVNLLHPDDITRVTQSLKNYLKNYLKDQAPSYVMEQRLRCKDGSYKWVLSRGTVVEHNNKGKPVRMIGIHSDITQRKDIEQSLIQAREEAETANRAKSQFLSSMSHELRTPMNAIMGFGQLLSMETSPALSESQQENVNEIVKAGDHLLELINQVLDLAKIEAGYIDLSIEAVVLAEVILESLQLITPLAQKQGIEISLSLNNEKISFEQLSEQRYAVRADRTRLRQILLNLLSNAVKYNNENGKINISCQHSENNQVRISISDTGKGIPSEQQEQLFQAFNRLDAENTEIEGTGIGLIITKNIVELMGGNIGVDSQLDKGSTFWFELPGDSLLQKGHASGKNKMTSIPTNNQEHEHTVLYIEDNPANLRLVTQLLGRLSNIHMWSAHESMLGLELAAEHKPDLILLDINLPGMNGFEVLEQLRQREATRNTPVIAISANAMPKDIEKGVAAGFDGYITKPIDVKAFMQAVEDILYDKTDSG